MHAEKVCWYCDQTPIPDQPAVLFDCEEVFFSTELPAPLSVSWTWMRHSGRSWPINCWARRRWFTATRSPNLLWTSIWPLTKSASTSSTMVRLASVQRWVQSISLDRRGMWAILRYCSYRFHMRIKMWFEVLDDIYIWLKSDCKRRKQWQIEQCRKESLRSSLGFCDVTCCRWEAASSVWTERIMGCVLMFVMLGCQIAADSFLYMTQCSRSSGLCRWQVWWPTLSRALYWEAHKMSWTLAQRDWGKILNVWEKRQGPVLQL